MDPLDDDALNRLLRQWEAPAPPTDLRPRRPQPAARWRWFLDGSIRIPVPVGIAALAVVALIWWFRVAEFRNPTPASPPVVSFADFQPVKEVIARTVE